MTEASYARTIESLQTSSAHGRTTQEARNNAATQYETDIACLFDAGFELTQAMLVMDLRDLDVSGKNDLIGKFMTGGMSAVDAEGKAVKFYARKDANRKDIILDNALMNDEEYRAFISEDDAINKTVNRKKTAWATTEEESTPAPRAKKDAKKSSNKKNGKSQQTRSRRRKAKKSGPTSAAPKIQAVSRPQTNKAQKPTSIQEKPADDKARAHDPEHIASEKAPTPEQNADDNNPTTVAAAAVFTETQVTLVASTPEPEQDTDNNKPLSENPNGSQQNSVDTSEKTDTDLLLPSDASLKGPTGSDDLSYDSPLVKPKDDTTLEKTSIIADEISPKTTNESDAPNDTEDIDTPMEPTDPEEASAQTDEFPAEATQTLAPDEEDLPTADENQHSPTTTEEITTISPEEDIKTSTEQNIQQVPDDFPSDAKDAIPESGAKTADLGKEDEVDAVLTGGTQPSSIDDGIIASNYDAANQTNEQGDTGETDANNPEVADEIDAALDPSEIQPIQAPEHRDTEIGDASSGDSSEDNLSDVALSPTQDSETPSVDLDATRVKAPEQTRVEPSIEGSTDESPGPENFLVQDEDPFESAQEEDEVATADEVQGNELPSEIGSDSFVPAMPNGESDVHEQFGNPDTDEDTSPAEEGSDKAETDSGDDKSSTSNESLNKDNANDTPPPATEDDRIKNQRAPTSEETAIGAFDYINNRPAKDPDTSSVEAQDDSENKKPTTDETEHNESPSKEPSSSVPVTPVEGALNSYTAEYPNNTNRSAMPDRPQENPGEIADESTVTHTERPSQPTFVPERPDTKQPGLFSRTRSYLGRFLSDDPNLTQEDAAVDNNDPLDGIGSDSSVPALPTDEDLGEENNGENTNAIDTPDVMNDAAGEYIPGDDPLPGQNFNADDEPFDQDNIPPTPTADSWMPDHNAPFPSGVIDHIDSHSSDGPDYPDSEALAVEGRESIKTSQPSSTPERPDKEDGVLARGLLWASGKFDELLNGDPDEQALRPGDEEPQQHQSLPADESPTIPDYGLDLSDNPAGIVVDSINSADPADEAFTELSPEIDPSSNPAGIIVDPIDPLRAPYVPDNTDNKPTANSRPLSEILPPAAKDRKKRQDPKPPTAIDWTPGQPIAHEVNEDHAQGYRLNFDRLKPIHTDEQGQLTAPSRTTPALMPVAETPGRIEHVNIPTLLEPTREEARDNLINTLSSEQPEILNDPLAKDASMADLKRGDIEDLLLRLDGFSRQADPQNSADEIQTLHDEVDTIARQLANTQVFNASLPEDREQVLRNYYAAADNALRGVLPDGIRRNDSYNPSNEIKNQGPERAALQQVTENNANYIPALQLGSEDDPYDQELDLSHPDSQKEKPQDAIIEAEKDSTQTNRPAGADYFSRFPDDQDTGRLGGKIYSGDRVEDTYAPIDAIPVAQTLFPKPLQNIEDSKDTKPLFGASAQAVDRSDDLDTDTAGHKDPYNWRTDKENYDTPERTPEETNIQWVNDLANSPFIEGNESSPITGNENSAPEVGDKKIQTYDSIEVAKQEFLAEESLYMASSHTVLQGQQRDIKRGLFLNTIEMQLEEQGESEVYIEKQLDDFYTLVDQNASKKPSLLSKTLGRLGLNGIDKAKKNSPATPGSSNRLRPFDPSGYSERQKVAQPDTRNLFELPPSNASDINPQKPNSSLGTNDDQEDTTESPENIIGIPEDTRDRDPDDWRTNKSEFDMPLADTTDNTSKQTRTSRIMKWIFR